MTGVFMAFFVYFLLRWRVSDINKRLDALENRIDQCGLTPTPVPLKASPDQPTGEKGG